MPYFKHQHKVHEVRDLGKGTFLVNDARLNLDVQPLDSHTSLLQQPPQQELAFLHQQGDQLQIWYGGEYYDLTRQHRASLASELDLSDQVTAPLTGKVILVAAEVGTFVAKGSTLVVLESMKMETALTAPLDAVIKAVHCVPGDQIGNGQLLVELDLKKEA